MNKQQALLEINQLKEQLNKWSYQYYVLDNPTVDDAEYDQLLVKLISLERKYPELITLDSPSQRVGGTVIDAFKKVQHQSAMLSLNNVFSFKEFLDFNQQIAKVTNTIENSYFAELKIDGLSISLVYENGVLTTAATRGDGIIGEDVTVNVKTIKSIPLTINKKSRVEIRGEIYLSKSEFEKINHERILNQEQLFANPRNAAAGTLRQLDSAIVAKRKLDAFLYYYLADDSENLTQQQSIAKLKELGFKTNPECMLCSNLDQVKDYIDKYTKLKDQLDYQIDGIVFKLNDKQLQQQVGYTVKAPKWATAYKFPSEIKTTKLLDIFPTVGRTGKITYNAKLEPVKLMGTLVSAASLHNAEFIKSKDLRINGYVKVKKAGDIIPEVLQPIIDPDFVNLKKWKPDLYCPACFSLLEKNDNEVDQFCINLSCPRQAIRCLQHFVSRNATNIVGLGDQLIITLFENKILTNILDIYYLDQHKEQILNLEGFAQKKYDNLIKAIDQSKSTSFDKVLFGLGIRHIGQKNARILAKHFKSIDNLKNATFEQLISIDSIGPVMAQSIVDWFQIRENIKLIEELKLVGLNFSYLDSQISQGSTIANKTFVITGTLSQKRQYFEEIILDNLGKVTSSITSKTDYLLAGENAGSKLKKAQDLQIKIINEQEFYNLLK
ncbi:NAD-dependent DNA ligase LigA [Mycoplasma putrefaciens]|uniref:DNA ligase n=1 Tax=Mycoplasma putrefaciens Mput9231 TaxID=1292033 RepID=M9WCJ9_9MOLU|nr:NAD-dependent DNA ligase LigA [Mycoplasma putrefaciens]AGJ90551.1 DNA ligase [Mycoplasma putrefaciens Mput9231]